MSQLKQTENEFDSVSKQLSLLAKEARTMNIVPIRKAIKKFDQAGSVTVAQRSDGFRLVVKDEGDYVKVGIDSGRLVDAEVAKNFPKKVFATKEEAFDFLRQLTERNPQLKIPA